MVQKSSETATDEKRPDSVETKDAEPELTEEDKYENGLDRIYQTGASSRTVQTVRIIIRGLVAFKFENPLTAYFIKETSRHQCVIIVPDTYAVSQPKTAFSSRLLPNNTRYTAYPLEGDNVRFENVSGGFKLEEEPITSDQPPVGDNHPESLEWVANIPDFIRHNGKARDRVKKSTATLTVDKGTVSTFLMEGEQTPERFAGWRDSPTTRYMARMVAINLQRSEQQGQILPFKIVNGNQTLLEVTDSGNLTVILGNNANSRIPFQYFNRYYAMYLNGKPGGHGPRRRSGSIVTTGMNEACPVAQLNP